jgi:hypothetical protein
MEIFAQGIFGNPSNLLNFIKIHNMLNRSLAFSLITMVCLAISCTKKSTPAPVVEVEENILFSLDPDPGTTTRTVNAESYSFKVILNSKMPTSGITIDYVTKADPSGVPLGSGPLSIKSNLTSNDISISQLASGSLYSVTVTVASQKTTSNTLTKTFKIARK